MSDQISKSFIREYESNVHLAYQRQGSKLRNTVRRKDKVKGASTTFQRVGKGQASQKARHGRVPTMSLEHTPIECSLQDFYAGDWVDRLDEIRISHSEQQVIENAGAFALGRKTDELIVQAMDGNSNVVDGNNKGLTKDKILKAFEWLGDHDIPDDGERYAVVGWRQWSELLDINEFKNADYVGGDDLPWKGTQAKRWLGTLWIPHSGLTKNKSNLRYCHWYHKTAVGHACGQEVTSDITWHGDRAAHFVNNMMSQGACLIDPEGVLTLPCLES